MLEIQIPNFLYIEDLLTAKKRIPKPEIRNIPRNFFKHPTSDALSDGINYFRVSPQLHLPELTLALLSVVTYELNLPIVPTMLASATLASWAINGLKALDNLHRYKRTYRQLTDIGWDKRIIRPMTATLCARNAARVAAVDAGFEREIAEYYEEIGLNGVFPICTPL